MRKTNKFGLASIMLVFILPAAIGLCCCTPDVLAKVFSLPACHQTHDASQAQSEEGCGHGDVIGELAKHNLLGVSFQLTASHFQQISTVQLTDSSVTKQTAAFDLSPPGALVPSTPLYLQVSVLRI
jgi:hypothetical protein